MTPNQRLHRDLRPIPLADAIGAMTGRTGAIIITMSEGQWDTFLAVGYDKDCILLELDDNEVPVRAYQKAGVL